MRSKQPIFNKRFSLL